MFIETNSIIRFILSVLLFPTFFQTLFLDFEKEEPRG